MVGHNYHKIIFVFLLVFLIGWSFLVYNFGADGLIEQIGTENSYLLAFLAALFGGMSVFTAGSFLAVIVTLKLGGLNLLGLVLFAGFGLFLGDCLFYYFGAKSRYVLPEKIKFQINRLNNFIKSKSSFKIEILIFIYFAAVPLPNDFLDIPLGALNFPFKRFILPVLLGDMVFVALVAFLAQKGFEFLF